jgi:hypothetical protein
MEQDKQLKNILMNGAERASAGFTDAVMQKVIGLAAAPFSYQPLVSPSLKRIFVFISGAVIAAILGLCLLLALANLHAVAWIQTWALPDLDYGTILLAIVTFWIVFTINSIIEKKFFLRKESHLEVG